jgi:prepilin-type N-terminal cleavage/methylation domain-containing protein/prepilin-type processing-associated H-X9-DG protein
VGSEKLSEPILFFDLVVSPIYLSQTLRGVNKVKQKGFTLVELLILVAIIAILVSILFPLFSQAGKAARKRTCLGNLKTIALASLMYADDNDNYLPIGYHSGGGRGNPNAPGYDGYPMYSCLAQGVLPYVGGDVYVFHCPNSPDLPNSYSYPTADPWGYGDGATLGWTSYDETSGSLDYIDNPKKTILLLCAPFNREERDPDATRAALVDWSYLPSDQYGTVKNPGEFWPGNLFDAYHCGWDQSWGSLVTQNPDDWQRPAGEASFMLQIHKGGTNYGYCDGSAKWHKLKQTRDGSD